MKRLSLYLFITVCLTTVLYAVPASPNPFFVTQPDGTQLTLHTMGDEYYHWVETTDNKIVLQNDKGYYEYATIENNEIVPSGMRVSDLKSINSLNEDKYVSNRKEIIDLMLNKRNTIIAQMDSLAIVETQQEINDNNSSIRKASASAPLTTGNQKVLCILIGFPDKPFTKTKTEFEAMWNSVGYNVMGSQGSVKEYYLENSYNHLNVTATIVGPYTAKHNSSYYDTGTTASTISNSKVKELIKEAIVASKNDIQFKNFDLNGDKYVDAIHVVFAGYGKESSASTGVIWSHQGQLNTYVLQGLYKAKEYFCTPELSNGSGTNIAPVGTVCHEYGHILGAPDYYDVSYSGFTGTGEWDLMGSGSWNNGGRCPAHHNPYTKSYIYNWAIPAIIPSSAKDVAYELTPSHNSAAFYRINTSTTNEFFLLENKQKAANTFNSGVPAYGGLLIYHIHSNIKNAFTSNNVNVSHPQKCYLVCSNATTDPNSTPSSYGNTYSAAYPSYSGNKIFFTSTSIPSAKSWAGVATGVDICFIKKNGNNIKFVVNPQIQGASTLTSESVYGVANIPAGTKIKWIYEYTPKSAFEFVSLGKPIIFVNGDSTSYVTIKRGQYPISFKDTTHIILPRDSTIILKKVNSVLTSKSPNLANNKTGYRYFSGTAILKATITSGGSTYTITKSISLSSANASASMEGNTIGEEDALEEIVFENDIDTSNDVNTLEEFRLQHVNPVSTNTAYIRVEKLENNNYLPFIGKYVLSLWSEKFGLVQHISNTQPNTTIDCSSLPNGIYQLVLTVEGKIVTSSKMLIL
ncbi:MAG: M6 family metalloprotease domain-containing protein [Paludibacteraceae bacterium]